MQGPKREGLYPDREIDCQEAMSQGIADLIEQATLSGTSEADAAAAISDTAIPGIRDLIDDAVAAGWAPEEAASAVKVVAAGMYRGFTGTEPDE
ncbi:hypothetical protein [Brucella sp. NBRC 12950]|uniref:hypothetical protein n=1 Tax=Brucella sp. NBRC 12950 TaxID=2994518 RepID=UPI0024A1A175|nr:hypothetical protein [Brucella sp. NBRC 12950]GLU29439.1 hypothetical protein Brsp01_46720 [Brucella sp. NBRC 12950]